MAAVVAARALEGSSDGLKRSLSFFKEIGGQQRQLRRTMSCTGELPNKLQQQQAQQAQQQHLLQADAAGSGAGGGALGTAPKGGKGEASSLVDLSALEPPVGRLREAFTFLLWILVFLVSVVSIPTLWVLLWRSVIGGRSAQAFGLWATAAGAAFWYRQTIKRRAPPVIQPILLHAEIFMCASMLCTISANTAFFFHTPGERLFDLGFLVVPEQAVDSPWRPLSDVLTIGLPFMMVGYSVLFCGRAERAQLVVDWFRLVAISYLLRSLTLVLTSLPGPAPHCDPQSGLYSPPEHIIDVFTKLGPLYGQFHTCGDLLFSGHTAWTTTTLLLFLRVTRTMRFPRLRYSLAAGYLCTMMLFAIAGRKHYTVDLVLAVMISSLTYAQFEKGWVPQAMRLDSPGGRSREKFDLEVV